jgi:hypothetical protein
LAAAGVVGAVGIWKDWAGVMVGICEVVDWSIGLRWRVLSNKDSGRSVEKFMISKELKLAAGAGVGSITGDATVVEAVLVERRSGKAESDSKMPRPGAVSKVNSAFVQRERSAAKSSGDAMDPLTGESELRLAIRAR